MVTEEELSNMSEEEIAELQKKNCIFCKIVNGEVPSKKVYEDDKILSIMDIRPATKGHILVLPKEHYPVLPVIPQETSKHMFKLTKDLCASIRKGLPSLGTTVFMANGAVAGQQSPHFLFHIIPRDSGDGLDQFTLAEKSVDQSQLLEPLQKGVGQAMQALLAQEGKMPDQESGEKAKEQLAMVLEENPEVRKLIAEKPEKFKQLIEENPQLKQVFQDINIDELSSQLQEVNKKEMADEDDDIKSEDELENSEDADLDKVSRLFK